MRMDFRRKRPSSHEFRLTRHLESRLAELDQFDAFEQPSSAGTGSPANAVHGAFLYNGSTYTDITASAYTGTNSISLDQLLLGYAEPFDQVNFNVATAGSKSVTWQYWNGSAWTALTLTSDGTSSLAQSGQVLFTPPSSWEPTAINGSQVKYWVKATMGATGTTPVVSKIYGDNWLLSGSKNCRGWSSTDSHRVNVGLGNLETIRLRPRARVRSFVIRRE